MAMLDDLPEMVTLVPAVLLAVGAVALTVFLIFWFGLGKQRTFEEAKAMASRQADLVLQEEYKNSPRNKKGKRQFPRKKKAPEEVPQEKEPADSQAPKGILKPVIKEQTPEKSPRAARVGFNIDIENPKTTPRTNPPTPHPNKTASVLKAPKEDQRTVQPIFEEAEEEAVSVPEPVKPVETKPPSKPPVEVAKKSSSPKASGGGKKKPKAKREPVEAASMDVGEGMPVSRISEIVSVSPLSDDDVQQLMSVLLEKINTNSEWEAANLRSESVKSLRKQNQDLLKRCEEAEQTMVSHNTKIKELRAEIQNEKFKQQTTETKLQAKVTSHNSEMAIMKTRLSGVDEELKQLKISSNASNVKKMEEENGQLRSQLHQLNVQCDTLNTQLKQATKLSDENSLLKAELARSKEAFKQASSGSSRPGKEVELESLLGSMEEEKQQLQVTMQLLNDENSRLKAEADLNAKALAEFEQQKTRTANVEVSMAALSEENVALTKELQEMRKTQELRSAESGAKYEEQVSTVREEYTDQLDGLKDRVAQLEGACESKDKEVKQLTGQIEKCSTLQDQLKDISEQLSGEQTKKKELEVELESLKQPAPNGPAANGEQTDGASNEELTKLKEQKEELIARVDDLEKKLNDIKDKNNSLRENLWSSTDKHAIEKKELEGKVKEAYRKTEAMVKDAKISASTETKEAHRAVLTKLFPAVCVEADSSEWLEEFESEATSWLSEKEKQISALEGEVARLQENEQKNIKEIENFRETLQTTMGILEQLQSQVEDNDAEHRKMVEEKNEMLEREKASNRGLQAELLKEREAATSSKDQVQANETKLSEAIEKAESLEQRHTTLQEENQGLRGSLDSEVEQKDNLRKEVKKLEEQCKDVEDRLTASQQQSQTDKENITKLEAEIEKLKNELKDSGQKIAQVKAGSPPPEVHTEV